MSILLIPFCLSRVIPTDISIFDKQICSRPINILTNRQRLCRAIGYLPQAIAEIMYLCRYLLCYVYTRQAKMEHMEMELALTWKVCP